MRIDLLKNEGKTVGWDIIGETEEEMRILGSMRNLLFFGINETAIKYDGQTPLESDDKYVHKLHFKTKGEQIRIKKEKRLCMEEEIAKYDDELTAHGMAYEEQMFGQDIDTSDYPEYDDEYNDYK